MRGYLLGGPRDGEWIELTAPVRPVLVVLEQIHDAYDPEGMPSFRENRVTYQLFRELDDLVVYAHPDWDGDPDETLDMIEDFANDPDLAGSTPPTPEPPRATSQILRNIHRHREEIERRTRAMNEAMKAAGNAAVIAGPASRQMSEELKKFAAAAAMTPEQAERMTRQIRDALAPINPDAFKKLRP